MRAPVPLLAACCVLCAACTAQVAPPPPPPAYSDVSTYVEFRSFLRNGYPEQDVFIETLPRAPELRRFQVTGNTQDLNLMSKVFWQPVYGAAAAQPHAPFETSGGKTYSKGIKIGEALQLWTNALGVGSYAVKEGKATLKLKFEDMMRGGTYSLWCARVSKRSFTEKLCDPALPPIQIDNRGRGRIELTFPAPPDSTSETGSWLMLAYHSDGHQKPIPDDFGKTTHVQVLYAIPTPAELRPAY